MSPQGPFKEEAPDDAAATRPPKENAPSSISTRPRRSGAQRSRGGRIHTQKVSDTGQVLRCTAMPLKDPLPFRLNVPGQDTLDWRGARSISYRLDGLLHLVGEMLTFEWAATRRTQRVSLTGVKDVVDESPVGTIEIPRGWITRAHIRGGWWAPRLQLWARRIDAFDGIPGARPGTLTLRIHRHDRAYAHALAEAIAPAQGAAAPTEDSGSLEKSDREVPRLRNRAPPLS